MTDVAKETLPRDRSAIAIEDQWHLSIIVRPRRRLLSPFQLPVLRDDDLTSLCALSRCRPLRIIPVDRY
jgi:hypothetical protein